MNKKTVNDRVIIAINTVLKLRPDLPTTMLSDLLGVSITSFSHLMSSRMNASVDIMNSLCLMFNISADWLLTGRGNIISNSGSGPSLSHMDMLMQLIDTVKQQAEEIGQLKARINQLESEE